MKILVVCTGNLCRSPMASAMLRHVLERRGCRGVEVVSAGTHARFGSPASPDVAIVLRGRGIHASPHRSRPLHTADLKEAHLIVAMTEEHRAEAAHLAPSSARKVRLLCEIEALVGRGMVQGTSTRERMQSLFAHPPADPGEYADIDDPIGLGSSAYERCADDLEGGIAAVAELVCGRRVAARDGLGSERASR